MALLPASAGADSHFQPCAAAAPFSRYYLGDSFEGLAITGQTYTCHRPFTVPPFVRVNLHDFAYGDCQAPPDGGCVPPVEVETTPACDRWWGSYSLAPPGEPVRRPRLVRLRGVPAIRTDGGHQIELYTGDVTVTVFADAKARAVRAVDALRGAPGSAEGVRATDPLPPPVHGALRGRIDCGMSFSKLAFTTRAARRGWRAIVRLSLPRAAYVDVDLERREHGRWVSAEQALFRVHRGSSHHGIHVSAGLYRATVVARDHEGRRTPVTTAHFRTGGSV